MVFFIWKFEFIAILCFEIFLIEVFLMGFRIARHCNALIDLIFLSNLYYLNIIKRQMFFSTFLKVVFDKYIELTRCSMFI